MENWLKWAGETRDEQLGESLLLIFSQNDEVATCRGSLGTLVLEVADCLPGEDADLIG